MSTTNTHNAQGANTNEISDNDLIIAIFGGKSFLKIYQALEIGKIKFSFVPKEDPKASIDCYMNVDDFVSDLINIIDTGEIRKLAYNAKIEQQKTGAKYASDIWESRAGIANNGSEEQIRKFSIQPGSTQEFMFRATQNGKNVTVGFGWRELKLLSYRWHFLEEDWNLIMRSKYNLKAMENTYHAKHNAEQVEAQRKEEMAEYDLPIPEPVSASPKTEAVEDNSPSYGLSSSTLTPENLPVEDLLPAKSASKDEKAVIKEEPKAKAVANPEPKETPKAQKVEEKPSNAEEKKYCSLKIKTPLLPMKNGGMAFQGWNEKNEIINVVIRPDRLNKGDAEIKRILEDAKKLGTKITFEVGEQKPDRVFVA